MILDIDAGNSRLKWRMLDRDKPEAIQAAGIVAESVEAACLATLASQVKAIKPDSLNRLRVASVRGEGFRRALSGMASREWQVSAEFAEVARECAGLVNGYDKVNTMGIDRWLAMVAAWSSCQSACCVLDCGSAITLDLVDSRGHHQGGYIVPGFGLLHGSLAGKSPALAVPVDYASSTMPGCSTSAAIGNGILAMVTGFTGYSRALSENKADNVKWFVTGGDATLISPHLHWQHQVVKDLVLDGLDLSLP